MNKIYKIVLIIAIASKFMGIVASENGAAYCPSTITVEVIYNLDAQGAFDDPELRPAASLGCYKSILEADIKKSEAFLKSLESGWTNKLWNSATQKLAGIATAGLGGVGYYYYFFYGKDRIGQAGKDTPVEAIHFYKHQQNMPEMMEAINQGATFEWSLHPRTGFKKSYSEYEIDQMRQEVARNKIEWDKIVQYQNIARIAGPLAILAGTALFGYSIYRNRTIASEKAKALESIYRDREIIEKIDKIENSIVL